MIDHVSIRNFRCLKEVNVSLAPLTVLIGPNDTGKSAFLDAVVRAFAGKAVPHSDHWRLDTRNALQISLEFGQGQKLAIVPSKGWKRSSTDTPRPYEVLLNDVQELDRSPVKVKFVTGNTGRPREEVIPGRVITVFGGTPAKFDLPSSGPRMQSQGTADQAEAPELSPTGENVPTLVDYLLRRNRKRFNALVTTLRAQIPGLVDVNVATPDPQQRRLDLVIADDLELPADYGSVGVRLMLFFAALAHHPTPPAVVLLEEPENGVHVRRLAEIMDLLHALSKGELGGHAAQVILTTHSPYLLDHVNLDEDQVLVFQRKDDGSRTAEPVDKERLKVFLDDFMLGEVWYNETEKGLIKRGE